MATPIRPKLSGGGSIYEASRQIHKEAHIRFYLMRHAEAVKGPEMDITREITAIGEKQAEWMARFLLTQTDKIKLVLHSDMHRGQQTAEIMAKELGIDAVQDPSVGPMAEPTQMMKTIKRVATDLGDDELLVIGHGPSINKFSAWLLNSGEGDKFHFNHGTVCHFDTATPALYGHDNQGIEGRGEGVRAYLHWMVTPKLVKRALNDDLNAVISEAGKVLDALADLLEAPKGESLRHPKHMRAIAPLRKIIQGIASDYFTAQGDAILKAVRKNIPAALEAVPQVTEAKAPKSKKFAIHLLPDDVEPLTFAVTTAEKNVFAQALQDAITKAGRQLAADLKSDATISGDKMTQYLEDHALGKLTGDWSTTTLEQLRNSIADSYASGGTADDIEGAIKTTVASFSDYRASMIAQTEVNDAYNFGRRQIADEAGMDEKAWDPDGEACDVCLENVDAGWIPIDDDFPSGADGPTAHPNCDCSLSFRISTGSVEESDREAGSFVGS